MPTARGLLAMLLLVTAAPLSPLAESGPAPATAAPWAKDAEVLLEGVREIAAPGVPGAVAVWGEKAFPLVLGSAGGVLRAPVVAAARWGKGRVVLLAHDGYLDPAALAVADTGRFLENALRWAAAEAKPRVGFGRARLASWLAEKGFAASALDGAGWTSRLRDVDVLLLADPDVGETQREALADFVARGGGLVAAQTPWGWMQIRREDDLDANGFQRLLAPAGLGWTDATSERTGPHGFLVADAPGLPFHAAHAVEALAASGTGAPKGLDARLASHVAAQAWRVLPPGERGVRGRVKRLLSDRAKAILPTASTPLRADRPLERFLLAVQVMDLRGAAPREVKAHPAAEAFPGAVPPGAKAETRSIEVDLAVPGWHGTGLYAPPGGAVTASLRGATAGEGAAEATTRLSLRIGCHADRLWHLDAWPRVPEITVERRLGDAPLTLANPFGGLVYVVVPDGARGRATVEIAGAVEAPRFVLGTTRPEDWKASRRAPGPWAELETSKVILTVPSANVCDLEDPQTLLAWWDLVLDADADLAGLPRERKRPERIVADVEISAGYMHSGYPIMTHLDAAPRMVDHALLSTTGDWGLFHELGHNHQTPDWTFDGTGEVTCNWFSMYVFETVVWRAGHEGDPPSANRKRWRDGHRAFREREAKVRAHLEGGAKFAQWKADPFLALFFYAQLIEEFGWPALRAVVAEYRGLPAGERPRTDDEKRDQWLVRYSRRVGRNLAPYFERWGIPTTEAARASLAALPPYDGAADDGPAEDGPAEDGPADKK